LHISPVWRTKEIREKEFKRMGPTHFRLSAKLRRNSREICFQFYPRCKLQEREKTY
jgi:hypothetical protein